MEPAPVRRGVSVTAGRGALAVVLGQFPGAAVLAHDYGPGGPADRLMAAGRHVALRDGVLLLDKAPVTAEALEAAAADLPGRGTGRALDTSRLTLRGPCPECGQDTACGWVEHDGHGWREIRDDPTPCTACRCAAMAGMPPGQDATPAPAAATPAAGRRPADGSGHPGRQRPSESATAPRLAPLPASLPPDVDPAAVVVFGRRVFAGGRQVATLAPPGERSA
jgi:hypothetical protein